VSSGGRRRRSAREGGGPVTAGGGTLTIAYHHDPEVPVLSLSGEFDIENVAEIERFLHRHLGPFYFRNRDLVLDLHSVTLVDSTFLGLVVSLVRRLHANRHELLITRPAGYVRRIIAVVGLPNLVPVYESLDEAFAALAVGVPVIPPPFEWAPAPVSTR